MKAIQLTRTGDASVLELKDVAKPAPGPGQVLLRVHAAGVNYVDVYYRNGRYPTPLPYVPGFEGAGVVEAVGAGVTEYQVGQRVAWNGAPGGYAEYAAIPEDRLIPLPEQLSFVQGAAFPLQGMTAAYLLEEYREVKPGTTVLIHAAAGGMGLLLVQWAKHLGATVFGTVSTKEKAALAKEAGADHVILYTEVDFAQEIKRLTDGKGVELIIDGVGKSTFAKNLDAAADFGTVVIYGAASGPAEPIAPNVLQGKCLTIAGGTLFKWNATKEAQLKRAKSVLDGVAKGWLKLRVEHVVPLAEAAAAHELLEGRKSTGKIVLKTAP